MNIQEGEIVAARPDRPDKLIVGPAVLVEPDLVSIRVRSGESRNLNPAKVRVYSINSLIDYFENHRQYGGNQNNSNDKRLKGVIRALIEGNISEATQQEIIKELGNIPEVRGQDAIAAL